jgi:hypothetical protein
MRRAPVTLVLVGAIIAVTAPSVAQASHRAVVPVRGATACKTRPPVLLSAGRLPRVPLRFDLAKMAGRSQATVDIDSADAKTRGVDGTWRPNTTLNTIAGVVRAGRLAHDRLPLSMTFHLSGSSYPTRPTFTGTGWVDTFGGGTIEGQRDDDHFPREAVGLGATWRVVKCDDINQTPAKEIRTYTLRSLSGGVVEMTYRDIVSIDPAHLAIGSQKIGGDVVHFRLVSLSGTAAGTTSIPLARGLAQTSRTVSRLKVTFSAHSPSSPRALIRTDVVDTDSSLLTG